ncbi:MAG TPA: hypothetical protein VFK06_11435 [Candidatus Angelobacter sp.]|nr:hypothetical protein [Candidatus Angelobacter sp.]
MPRALSEIERLDLAARVQPQVARLSRRYYALLLLWSFANLLAFVIVPGHHWLLLMRILSVLTVVGAVIVCFPWRYRFYGEAIFLFVFLAASALPFDQPEYAYYPVLGWIATHFMVFVCIYWFCLALIDARRYAVVYRPDWQAEREQMEKWMPKLTGADPMPVAEFALRSFRHGNWTCRILNTGDYWIITRFKRSPSRLIDCRVYDLHQVAFTKLANGEWKVTMKQKQFAGTIKKPLPPAFYLFYAAG